MLGQAGAAALLSLCSIAIVALADEQNDLLDALSVMQRPARFYDAWARLPEKRDIESSMPGVLRFGKRAQSFIRFGRADGEEPLGKSREEVRLMMQKKEMPGVLRFGKRSQDKKSMPGVLRFGKRSDMPGVLRFGKRNDIPGVLRFGKKSVPGVLRFGRK